LRERWIFILCKTIMAQVFSRCSSRAHHWNSLSLHPFLLSSIHAVIGIALRSGKLVARGPHYSYVSPPSCHVKCSSSVLRVHCRWEKIAASLVLTLCLGLWLLPVHFLSSRAKPHRPSAELALIRSSCWKSGLGGVAADTQRV